MEKAVHVIWIKPCFVLSYTLVIRVVVWLGHHFWLSCRCLHCWWWSLHYGHYWYRVWIFSLAGTVMYVHVILLEDFWFAYFRDLDTESLDLKNVHTHIYRMAPFFMVSTQALLCILATQLWVPGLLYYTGHIWRCILTEAFYLKEYLNMLIVTWTVKIYQWMSWSLNFSKMSAGNSQLHLLSSQWERSKTWREKLVSKV